MPDGDKECTYTLPDGTHYDLSSLSSGAKDYEATSNGTKYALNVCRGVLTELSHVEEPGKVGAFFERPDGKGHFSIGQYSTKITLSPGTNEPLLVYQHGSQCPTNDKELSSTVIRFMCSQSDFGAGSPQLIAALPPGPDACHFFFEWKTHVACTTSQRGSNNGMVITFVSFILIAILTWFGGHTLYNRFFLHRRGLDQFPLPRCSAPKLSLGGNSDGERPARSWGFRRSQRGYNHLRTEPDEEDSLAAARFSLEDEDDEDDARALGGEVNAWRGHTPRRSSDDGDRPRVGAHQGLVDL